MDSKIIIMLVIMFVFIGFIVAAMIFALKKANVKQDIVLDQEQSDSTQANLPFEDIRDSMIHLGNHQYRVVLSCTSVNYGLKTDKEQDIIELAFQRFLNSLTYPISIYVQTRTMDNEKMMESLRKDTLASIEEYPILENYGEAYFEEMSDIYDRIGNNKEKRKYVIIPFDEANNLTTSTDEEKYDYVLQEMKNRIIIVKESLDALGISATLLNTPDLIDLLYVSYHKDSANQADNLINHEFLDMIVSGNNKLQELSDKQRLDWILAEAQNRLKVEIMDSKGVDEKTAKRADVAFRNIDIIRNKIAGDFKDKTISN